MQENTQTLSRRDLMKAGVAASAAATVGIPITPVAAQAAAEADAGIRWQKGVCPLLRHRAAAYRSAPSTAASWPPRVTPKPL